MSGKDGTDRRGFLKVGAFAGAGLVIGFHLPVAARGLLVGQAEATKDFSPNAYLEISRDNEVKLWVAKSEMGQGVRTSLPMILADELEVDWSRVRLAQAATTPEFRDVRLRTSGSGSVAGFWRPLRQAGAAAREMLIIAAAQKWSVARATCRAEKNSVIHAPTGRRFTYGELVETASKLPVPKDAPLKEAKDFRIIGDRMKRVDGGNIVNGSAVYGFDVRLPNMRYATVARSPVIGGKVARWDDGNAKRVSGVRQVLAISTGIAVVADNTWAAIKGRDALEITWDEGPNRDFNSDNFRERLKASFNQPGFTTRKQGEVGRALESAASRIEAIYEYPFQAHAPMEPMNCVANVRKGTCELWVSTQAPHTAQELAAKLLGLELNAVKVNVPLLGGGFGRRLFCDYVPEAVEISNAVGAPVQVIWTRQDDMKHGFFHPATVCKMTAGLDQTHNPTVWTHRTASTDLSMFGPPDVGNPKRYEAGFSPWGAYDTPYHFSSLQVDYIPVEAVPPTGPWRAVGYPQNTFARECFLDELAYAAGQDPLKFRLQLLSSPEVIKLGQMTIERARLRGVLELAAEKANWRTGLPQGRGRRWGRGIACNVYHGQTHIAQVAEVSVDRAGNLTVHRIICAVDCGLVVNPLGLEGQIESGIIWGLSAVLRGQITFKNGRAEQSSYRDFPVMRIQDTPRIETHIVPNPTRPWGIGEQPVPPVAPAVVNAVFAATGKRIRRLPIRADDLLN